MDAGIFLDEFRPFRRGEIALARRLADEINGRGFQAYALAASERTDKVNIKGDFPHKTAATRAGLGWIGRHCQLITRKFGSWIRLGTVFTDVALLIGTPLERSFCGRCMRCVEACPANALKGNAWYPELQREKILDVAACDRWKKENYFEYYTILIFRRPHITVLQKRQHIIQNRFIL